MKNKIFKLFLYTFFFLFSLSEIVTAQNIQFQAKEIITLENGNLIIGKGEAIVKIDNNLEIVADKFTYNKKKKILISENNINAIDFENNIKINSQLMHYLLDKNEIISFGKSFFNIEEKYKIISKDVTYEHNKGILYSKQFTTIEDKQNNFITTANFKYLKKSQILSADSIDIKDNQDNKYFVQKGNIRLNEKILEGKDISIYLKNDTFGNPVNEPRLKGNSISYNNNKTIIKKGIFTSCKKNDDNCPPWSITSKEIAHDKEKREISYKNAWLKIYNVPVLYFPKFFHPDPTVKRRSGFLIPQFSNSQKLGSSFSIPYFFAISESEDLTFTQQTFSTKEHLLQTEYRKETKNSSHILDISFSNDESISTNSKTHFFSNSFINFKNSFFEESSLFLKLEKVSNDNYLSIYGLENSSPIIKDTSTLESKIELSANNQDLYIDLSFEVYEKMNLLNSDKYEFIYPNYSLGKTTTLDNVFLESFDLISSGNQKLFSTNVKEVSQINDLLFSSREFLLKGIFENNFKFLIKNVNTDGKNSTKYKSKTQSEIFSNFIYDISIPLKKDEAKYLKYITPKLSLRYSPDNTKNISTEDRYLNIDNIYSINRIGFNDTIEGGTSLTLGNEYSIKDNKSEKNIFNFDIATIFRDNQNNSLPLKSSLNKTQSDIVGSFVYNFNDHLNFEYDFSLKNNLKDANLHLFKNTFQVNNFINTFEFYEENNYLGNESYFANTTTFEVDNKNSFSFKTRRNKKTNLTEFYNLIYEYKNDCLIASIKYNKEYYNNNIIKPKEDLFFNITLIPLGSTKTENLIQN